MKVKRLKVRRLKVTDDVYGAVEAPSSHAPLPKQLGTFPLWRTSEPLLKPLEPVYEAASVAGIELFEAEKSRPDVDD